MHPNPIPESNAERDERNERGALTRVLFLHPTQLSLDELLLELRSDVDGGPTREQHERAVRELVACGLLRREGDSVLPTRAALRFGELWA